MHRFWTRYIGPVIETVQPRRIIEIGAEFGWNTTHILQYCRRAGAHADIIDPVALPSLVTVLSQFPEVHAYHSMKSVDAIPALDTPDIAFVDGDHNWRTVYTELNLLYDRALQTGATPPLILAHDCAWPYARRDMYYAPEEFNPVDRHKFAYRGILPGQSELTEEGLNGHLANAVHEGGPENGVLTGIEDFVASTTAEVTLYVLPFFNGLGIVVPKARMTPALQSLIDSFYSGETMLETCKVLEEDGMRVRAELKVQEGRLARRTEALERARTLLAERAARIETLEAQLAAAKPAKSKVA
jgi:hypothetical protein